MYVLTNQHKIQKYIQTGVDLGWWGPCGKQRGGAPFVVVCKTKFSVKSDVFQTRQIRIKFLLYNC